MAYTTINKPNTNFNPVLYTGNGATNAITGVNFQPDFVWVKGRTNAPNHYLFDVVRGVQKNIHSNSNDAEVTEANTLTAFDSDGFTLGSDGNPNGSGQNYVGWNWKAGGTASSNTDGSITSSVSSNTTAGFSIVSFTGTGATATVGHGLGTTPKFWLVKSRSSGAWWTYTTVIDGSLDYLFLDTTVAANDSGVSLPTSSVFSVNGSVAPTSENMIAYCFADVKGYSKFGSYTGNGNADGTFVYTGFKPAFIMFKRTNSTSGWGMYDNKRTPFNLMNKRLLANTSGAEDTSADNGIDFLSNGFKWKTGSGWNASGGSYIYMAFAENPLVGTNNVPATAR